ncbi:MAG: prenyltransferase/squalene oxidase repeat-containing protein [Solirubrobacteraceae bacterium]
MPRTPGRRIAITTDRRSRRSGTASAVVALLLGCVSLGPAPATAAPDRAARGGLDRLVGFLQDVQNDDGGYGGRRGAASAPEFSAWVGLGLAAAGINPRDQIPPGGRRSVVDFVARSGPVIMSGGRPVTTEYQRIGMLAVAAGDDPRRFGGRDYVGPLLARQATAAWSDGAGDTPRGGRPVAPGWFAHTAKGRSPGVNDTVFAVMFLVAIPRPHRPLRQAVARGADAIASLQRPDGAWPSVAPNGAASTDVTGAAVQTLCAAGRCDTEPVRRAVAWLRATQNADGGWGTPDLDEDSNGATTPWVVQALWATGVDPRDWRGPDGAGADPLTYLAGLQQRDGSLRWTGTSNLNPVLVTAYAAPAFAGHPWPVPAPPRAAEVRRRERQATRRREQRRRARAGSRKGQGGVQRDADGEVVAGGGGRGAELFARPQPGSRGATTGGERDTEKDQERRDGPKGRDGATGTAAASGVGSDGGVQNASRAERHGAAAVGGSAVSGTVVERPRGTEGRGEEAVAAGLRAASLGTTGTPWAPIGLGGLVLLCAAAGAVGERRSIGR